MKRFLMKFSNLFVLACTFTALTSTSASCKWFLYQPEEPECLRKNK